MSRTEEDPKNEQLLKVKEFADLIGVCVRKAFELIAAGEVPVVTLSSHCRRVRRADALAFIAARRSK